MKTNDYVAPKHPAMRDDTLVNMTQTANTVRMTPYHPYKRSHRVLSDRRYFDFETGEIKVMNESLERDPSSINRAFKRFRDLINTNFTGTLNDTDTENELFITLTYADGPSLLETDSPKVRKEKFMGYRDEITKFTRRLRKAVFDVKWAYVIEMQKTGRPHVHLLLKNDNVRTWHIENKVITDMWGLGHTSTKRLNNPIGLGKYLSKGTNVNRLPKGVKLTGSSRNLKKPDKRIVPARIARALARHAGMSQGSYYTVTGPNGEWLLPIEERRVEQPKHYRSNYVTSAS